MARTVVIRDGVRRTRVVAPDTDGDPLALPLVQAADWPSMITYLGVLRVPSAFDYGGGAMWVDTPSGYIYGTAIDTGFPEPMRIGRMTVPAFGGTGSLVGSLLEFPNADAPQHPVGSGSILHGGKLHISSHGSYDEDVQNTSRLWIVRCNPDFTSMGQINRMQPNKNGTTRALAGVFTKIPAVWQTVLGGPMGTCSLNASIISSSCPGFGLGIFDPADVQDTTADVPVDVVLCYDAPDHLIQPGTWFFNGDGTEWFSVNDGTMAAIIPDGSRSLLFVHVHGSGSGNPECRVGSSTHTGPYSIQVTAYDLADIVDVKNGLIEPWEPLPYAHWYLTPGSPNGPFGVCCDIRQPWSCYDHDTGRLYAAERFWQNDGIHTWQIGPLA